MGFSSLKKAFKRLRIPNRNKSKEFFSTAHLGFQAHWAEKARSISKTYGENF